jgi:hypothetical protein
MKRSKSKVKNKQIHIFHVYNLNPKKGLVQFNSIRFDSIQIPLKKNKEKKNNKDSYSIINKYN